MTAIEESSIAIIIFSEDYASSRWCLEELVKIMECKTQKNLIVLPVFYKVEPREVRRAMKGYGRAMAMHESNVRKDTEIVKRWKKALSDAGSLSGWYYNNEDEAEFIRGIVTQVSSRLEPTTPLYIAKYPVGINSQVQEVISLSQKEWDGDDVLMIGIWGPGGIGKMTITKATYNANERHFQKSTFLEQVRETSNKYGLVELQKGLLSQILSPGHLTVYSEGRGSSLIREKFRHKKILLVLDDVDDWRQLDMLAGGGDWFGKGSRIFVTSRDKHLLTSHGINHVYEVKPLDQGEALDLFNQHAFPHCKKPEIKKDLIDRVLHYASGFPLALVVLGSFLCGKEEPAWESALHNLSKSPDQTINKVLKTSFEGLANNAREVFLDIACLFKGNRIEYIKKVIDNSRDFDSTIEIEILIERSLIRNVYGTLQMHDLKEVHSSSQDPVYLPNNLRWLEWSNAPFLEFRSGRKKLVGLDIQKSHIRQVDGKFKNFECLKYINFSQCKSLVSVPDLSSIPNLESLNLDGCKSLVEVHQSVACHDKLKFLSLQFCFNLGNFPHTLKAKSLQALDLFGCFKLEKFSDIPEKMEHLEELDLGWTAIKELPASVENLVSVKIINLRKCKRLPTLPSSVYKLQNLKYLNLGGCSNFVMFQRTRRIQPILMAIWDFEIYSG
ncbi:disease resistance protein RPV1 [Eucalyptus grandis]|uniref:disease resistance protein RPV1 n=1 Tax=Eucalyptus grandis TaxID=71139 RepID=UPI00192EEB43|nr:disease resistance protein RPV1 [Eucalyptus grandis]